jgi:hypothetical protein
MTTTIEYRTILDEMNKNLNEFSKLSGSLSAYEYEKQFREITDHYDQLLFQASLGKVPASKNERNTIQTGYGDVSVKKNTL